MRAETAVPAAYQEHGQLPDGWRRMRNKVFMREVNRPSVHGSEEMLSVSHLTGVTPRSEKTVYMFEAESTVGYKLVKPGDLAINTMWAWMGAAGVSRVDGIVSPAYGVYEIDQHRIDPRWVGHMIRAPHYVEYMTRFSRGVTSSRLRLYPDEFLRMEMVIPPLDEQRTIADFLDAETARIDDLVSARTRQGELLRERLAAGVDALVLGLGLPGEQPRSAFFSSTPAGWTETALRHLGCEVQTGPFGSQLHADEYVEDGWPVVNPMNLVGGRIVATPGMAVSDEKRTELSRHVLRAGDIVFGRRGELGRAGLVEAEHKGWLCGTGSLRLRLTGRVLIPSFLKLLLETSALRSYFELQSVGSTMDNLNAEIVLGTPCLVPPTDDQLSIVEEVHTTGARLDRLASGADRQVALLQERKQALITAAVTGQLDMAREIAEEAS